MPDILKKTLNTRSMLLCLFTLIMAISAGVFFGSITPAADIHSLAALLQGAQPRFFPAAMLHLSSLLLMLLAGFTVYGFPLVFFILFSRGFAVGFCDCLLLYSTSSGGIINFIFSFLIPQLMLCGIYLLASAVSTGYALSQLKK